MQRIVILVYGLVAYVTFFVTFLYLIGFTAGLVVPKTVNDGPLGPAWLAIVVDLGLVALFGLQHAVMARPAFKAWWTRIVPEAAERSTYVLASCAALGVMYWQWRPIDVTLWRVENAAGAGVLWGLFGLGWAMVLLSSFLIDHFDLFGLRQVVLNAMGKPYTHKVFVLRSLYKLVRHPLMLGFLIAFWAAPVMTGGRLLLAALMTTYILLGTRLEERDLVAMHGEAYRAYQRSTPGLIPGLRSSRAAERSKPQAA